MTALQSEKGVPLEGALMGPLAAWLPGGLHFQGGLAASKYTQIGSFGFWASCSSQVMQRRLTPSVYMGRSIEVSLHLPDSFPPSILLAGLEVR